MSTWLACKRTGILVLMSLTGITACPTVFADSGISIPTRQAAAKVNEDTIGVVFTHEELFHQLVHNLERELEQDSGLRIVPIMGKNHVQSIYDLLYLKGVDLALVRADAIEFVKRESDYPGIQRVIKSVAKVSEEKIVIISRKDYQSLEDLAGQVVGFGLPGSGEYVTGTIAFGALEIVPEHLETDNKTAIEKVKSGELAAMVYLLRAPDAVQTGADLAAATAVKALKQEDELHVLPIPASEALSSIYTAVTLTHDDLPGLIGADESISSYSVDAIIAAYKWSSTHSRYKQSARFVNALMDGLDGLQNGVYQPAWKRVDLALATPNVETLPLVKDTLDERVTRMATLAEATRAAREKAEADAQAEKVAQLIKMRDELTARLGKELTEADTGELERMLGELNSFLKARE